VAQAVAVVGVLVARRDREHPQPQHFLQAVADAFRVAPIRDAPRQPRCDSQPPLHLAQQQHAGIRRHLPAVESHAHLLSRNRWQLEGQLVILIHDGCGAPQSDHDAVSQPES